MTGLLLDFGGVLLLTPFELHKHVEARLRLEPGTLAWMGPFDLHSDPLWASMQKGQLSERQYWVRRAAEVGKLVGEKWNLRDYMRVCFDGPEDEIIRPEARAIVDACKQAAIRTGILTNELELFHGMAWMRRVSVIWACDVLIDASTTGVMKPDPRAYQMAVRALELDPPDVVFVDDQDRNIGGGRAAGLNAVAFDVTAPSASFAIARAQLGLPPAPSPDLTPAAITRPSRLCP